MLHKRKLEAVDRSKAHTKQETEDTYILTPCSRVLLEKLTGFQLVKKFPAFYET